MKKRFLFTLVLVFVFCTALAVVSSAAMVKSGSCGENVTYTLDSDGLLTISGSGAMTDYTSSTNAPWYFKRLSVKNVLIENGITSIGKYAFENCISLTGVEIPDSIKTIGNYAFKHCISLESVEIPDSIKTIGNYAFENCISLTGVEIPNGVNNISDSAFLDCMGLTSVTISSSVESIGDCAFSGCTSLTSVNIPSSVESIGACAFYQCTSLTSVTISSSVKSIGNRVFGYSDNEYKLVEGFIVYGYKGSVAETYAKNNRITFIALEESETIVEGTIEGTNISWVIDNEGTLTVSGEGAIPDYSRTSVAPWNVYAKDVKKIVVEDGITEIGNYAFYNLSNAASIELSDTVKSLGTQFIRGTAITEITLPAVETIKNQAFARADSLTTLIAGESIRDIYGTIFYSENVTVKAPKDSYIGKYAESFAELFTVDATVVFESTGDAVRPVNYFGKCGENCFYAVYQNSATSWAYEISGSGKMKNFPYVSDKNIALGYTFTPTYYMEGNERNILSAKVYDGVTTLGNYTFFKCTKMTDIELHNGITSIGRGAFQACARLEAITVPDAVTRIERTAFNGCTALTDVYIPEGVTVFEDSVFAKCNTEGLTVHTDSPTVINVIYYDYPEIMVESTTYDLAFLLYTTEPTNPVYNPESKMLEYDWFGTLLIDGKEVEVQLGSIDGYITSKYVLNDKDGDGISDPAYLLVNYTVNKKTGRYNLSTLGVDLETTVTLRPGASITPHEEEGLYYITYSGVTRTFRLSEDSTLYYTYKNPNDGYLYYGIYNSENMPQEFMPKTTSQRTYLVRGRNNVYTLLAGVVSGEFEPVPEDPSATFKNDARLIKYCAEGSTAEAIDGVGYYTYLFLDFTTMKNGVQTIDTTLSIENGATKAVAGYFYGWDYATKKYVRVTTDNTDAVQTGTLTAVDATRRIVYIDGVSFTVGNKTFDFSQGFKLPEKVNIFSTAKNNLYEYKNFDTSSLAALLEIANENGKTLDVAVGAYPLDDGSLGIAWIMVDNYYYAACGESEILTQTFDIVSRISGTAK